MLLLGLRLWPLTNRFAFCPAGHGKPVAYACEFDETQPMEASATPSPEMFSMAMPIDQEPGLDSLDPPQEAPRQVGADEFKNIPFLNKNQ